MTLFQAIFLSVIQGLTEFLPISSSGHLVIFQNLFGLKPPVLFDILVHVGTLGAILIYFRHQLIKITRQEIWLLIIGTVPAGLAGFFLKDYLEVIFSSPKLVGFSWLITALLLFSTKRSRRLNRQFNQLKWSDTLFVGFFQALALLPGVSRSGATITAGLWRQFSQESSLQLSFYLAIPAILGALTLQIPDLINSSSSFLLPSLLGMFIAGSVAYYSLQILEKILKKGKLFYFGFYCLTTGFFSLALSCLFH